MKCPFILILRLLSIACEVVKMKVKILIPGWRIELQGRARKWQSLRERTRILFFHMYFFFFGGGLVGKFVKHHDIHQQNRWTKRTCCCLGRQNQSLKRRSQRRRLPKRSLFTRGVISGSKNDKPRTAVFGWLVGHKGFWATYHSLSQWWTFNLLGIPYSVGKKKFKLLLFHGPLAE